MSYTFNALGITHKFIEENLSPGDICIDATAGRGRDTLFLAKIVGEEGSVIALDIQKEAIESTAKLLEENGIENAKLHLSCHSKIDEYAPKGSVSCIVFNFGYLPGGDRNLFSKSKTSVAAIEKALGLLKSGGVMTLCLYYGKENGFDEKDAILEYLKTVDQKDFSVLVCDFWNRRSCPPIAVLIRKE